MASPMPMIHGGDCCPDARLRRPVLTQNEDRFRPSVGRMGTPQDYWNPSLPAFATRAS